MYKCSVCGAEVDVKDAVIVRNCEHSEAPIVADMIATCQGVGGTKVG